MSKYRSLSASVFIVVVCALVGGLFGRGALAQDQLDQQYRVLADALQAIESTYVGDTEADRLVYGAIGGMLQTLDPHSSFMDPNTYRQMRERQEGRYYGLGITIGSVDGDLTVSTIFEGSPAWTTGLRRGDVIARIAGKDTKGWTTDEAVKLLRGNKGTTVNIPINGYSNRLSSCAANRKADGCRLAALAQSRYRPEGGSVASPIRKPPSGKDRILFRGRHRRTGAGAIGILGKDAGDGGIDGVAAALLEGIMIGHGAAALDGACHLEGAAGMQQGFEQGCFAGAGVAREGHVADLLSTVGHASVLLGPVNGVGVRRAGPVGVRSKEERRRVCRYATE